jgi:hypothetical protein
LLLAHLWLVLHLCVHFIPHNQTFVSKKSDQTFSYLFKFSLMTENKSHPSIQVLEYFRTPFLTMKHSVISNMLNNDKVACVRLPACTCTYGVSGYPPMLSDGCAYPTDLCYIYWWWLIFANDVNVTSKTTTLFLLWYGHLNNKRNGLCSAELI